MSTEKRLAFLDWLLLQENHPALWGAKGPFAFDCSGLVTCGYVHVGLKDWRQTHNTDRLWAELEPTSNPIPGDLVLYGGTRPDDVQHVMVWWGDGRVYGACGATSAITTLHDAVRAQARVRFRRLHYRTDLRGYRHSPFETATPPPRKIA